MFTLFTVTSAAQQQQVNILLLFILQCKSAKALKWGKTKNVDILLLLYLDYILRLLKKTITANGANYSTQCNATSLR